MHFLALFSAALAGLAAAAPSPDPHVLHEKRDGEPVSWTRHARAIKSQVLPIRIGLKQRNLHHVNRFIDEVADPDSPKFGKHWTAEQVANMFAPAKETSDRTVEWLTNSGISSSRIKHSVGRNWIEFSGTVEEAERLFDTEYHIYKQKESGGFRMACDSYSLPQSVRKHVDFVMPTIQLDGLKPVANARPAIEASITGISGLTGLKHCGKLITIDCIRAIYDVPVGKTNHSGNEIGIGEWADYLYLPDLKIFFENYTSPPIPPKHPS